MGRFKDSQESVPPTVEFHRIRAIPRRVLNDAELEHIRVRLTNALRRPGGKMELRAKQAQMLHDIGVYGGGVGIIRVGGGKTLISLLAPAMFDPEPRRPLLITKAALIDKTRADYSRLKEHWLLPTGMEIKSFEFLGRVNAADFLEKQCRPDLIIIDECHFAKNKKAGVTRRLVRYLKEHPDTRVIVLSGTFMKASLKDAAHLIRWALKGNAPVPVHESEVDMWADALDAASRVNPLQRFKPGALLEFATKADWEPRVENEHVTPIVAARRGFQRRLIETGGVVATGGDQVSCSLNVIGREFTPNAATEANFAHLRSTWRTPDDWQLYMAMEVWSVARQLSLGFHYTWLDAERWRTCLGDLAKRESGTTTTIVPAILNAFAHTTVNEQEISEVLGPLRRKGTTGTFTATGSHLSSTTHFSPSSTVSATSAERGKLVQRLSTLITTTGLGRSAGYSAAPVTELSACLEILSTAYPQLCDTLRVAETVARPPEEWSVYRKLWFQFVRESLKHSRTLDTPRQVADACRDGALDRTAFDAWERVRPSFTPTSKAIWHDSTVLEICEDYAKRTPGIIWTEHSFFARELARRTGLQYFGRDGLDAMGNKLDTLAFEVLEGREKPRAIIASIKANSTGRNLQGWSENLITSIPTEAAVWEQLLGRTHRDLQRSDEVNVSTLFGCHEHYDGWIKAVELAEATQDTEGTAQKLCMATCIVPPVGWLPGPRWQKTDDEKGTEA